MRSGILSHSVAIASSIIFIVTQASSQTCPDIAGCLDPTFGTAGKVMIEVHSTELSVPQGIALQSDGKMVAFVRSGNGFSKLFRLNADGSLDESFGSGGIVTIEWSTTTSNGSRYIGMVHSLAIQNVAGQERIVLSGFNHVQSGRSMVLALRLGRYLPDGTLDDSFGTGGKVAIAGESGAHVAIQPADQKIVTVGGSLVRLNVNGGLDTTFGTGGKVSVGQGYTRGIAFDSAGGVLISGKQTYGNGKNATQRMTLRRYRSNGTLDTAFGTNGTASAAFGFSSMGISLAIDPMGKIVVSGLSRSVSGAGSGNFGVARFTATGQLDTSFAGTGTAVFDFGGHDDVPSDVLLEASGKIIVAGHVWPATAAARDFGAVRLNYDGSLDTTFGDGGKMVTNVYGVDYSRGSVLQFDPLCACEKLVMSGGDGPYTTFARFSTLP